MDEVRLISYFLGELLVIYCQINTVVLKCILRNWTVSMENLNSVGHLISMAKQQIPWLSSEFCRWRQAVVSTCHCANCGVAIYLLCLFGNPSVCYSCVLC